MSSVFVLCFISNKSSHRLNVSCQLNIILLTKWHNTIWWGSRDHDRICCWWISYHKLISFQILLLRQEAANANYKRKYNPKQNLSPLPFGINLDCDQLVCLHENTYMHPSFIHSAHVCCFACDWGKIHHIKGCEICVIGDGCPNLADESIFRYDSVCIGMWCCVLEACGLTHGCGSFEYGMLV